MKSGGTEDSTPPTSQENGDEKILADWRAGDTAARIASGLPAITIVMKADGESCGWTGSARMTLWGKDVRNNPKSLAAWSAFSQLVMITLNGIGVEFMEASWSNDPSSPTAAEAEGGAEEKL